MNSKCFLVEIDMKYLDFLLTEVCFVSEFRNPLVWGRYRSSFSQK